MLRSLFALGVIGIFALFAIRSHYAAMLMYWWFSIFRPHEWMWWDLSAWRLPLLAAALFIIPALIHNKTPVLSGVIPKLILTLLIVTFLGSVVAGCLYPNVWNVTAIATLIFVSLLSARLMTSSGAIVGMFAIVGLSLCYRSASAGLASTIGGGSLYNITIGGGSFMGTNAVSLGSAMAIFFLAVVYQHIKAGQIPESIQTLVPMRLIRVFALPVLAAVMVGAALFVVRTESRGSALALGLGLVVWILLHRKRFKLILVAAILGTIAISFVPLPDGYIGRIANVFDESVEQDRSAASRPHFWRIARKMAADRPFGVGPGCFSDYYDAYDDSNGFFGQRRSVHSSHFLVVAEQGYFGALIWFSLISVTFLKLWSMRKDSLVLIDADGLEWQRFHVCNGLITVLLVFVLGASFYEFVYNDYIWLVFASTVALDRMGKD